MASIWFCPSGSCPTALRLADTSRHRNGPHILTEPLLRYHVQYREDRGEPLRLIIEFLQSFYSSEQLRVLPCTIRCNTPARLRRQAMKAREGLSRDLELPETLLVGGDPQLFAEADRLKAERELRLAVVPPLSAIAIFLTWNQSWSCR